jgi:dihydroflavonol-4-reductase
MKHGKERERYILGGVNLSYLELFKRAGQVAEKKFRLYPMPLWIMLVASWIMLRLAEITGKPPAITPGWVKKYNHNWQLSSEKAVVELGYMITPFEEAVKKTLSYYKTAENEK